MPGPRSGAALLLVVLCGTAPRATAQTSTLGTAPRPWGRVSFFATSSRWQADGLPASTYGDLQSSITFQMPEAEGDGFDFGVDLRHTRYMVEDRDPRLTMYDAYVGGRLMGGTLRVRGGHMWLNELGGLGSVAGGMVEVRSAPGRRNRLRVGAFGGLEPRPFRMGYADHVTKGGAYVAVDGARSRRHVAGLITVRNGGLTERSVLTFTNYLPIGQSVFLYQAGEYDVRQPLGAARGGLTYLFASGRVNPTARVELLGTYNRGRSIDARSLADDILNGRPVSERQLEGLLYESVGGRVTVEVVRRVRVYTGYSRDRNNRDDAATGRWLLGGHAADLGGSGFDVTVSDSRLERSTGRYHALYASLGRQIGRSVYADAHYSSSLSVVRFVRADGIVIESRPSSTRFGGSAVVNTGRSISILVDVERTLDDAASEFRLLSGITYRFR